MANEKRLDLIDRQAVVDDISKIGVVSVGTVLSCLSDAKRVDAVEVVHGRWMCTYDENTGETDVTCSHCKDTRTINGCYVTSTGESCYFEDNYCPNCGAKMDEKE